MKAVLVGLNGDSKLYYDLDASASDPDGVVEKPNGDTYKVDFFSYVASSLGLKKLMTTSFHRRLWDEPTKQNERAWVEMFVDKTRKPTDKMLDDLDILSTLGRNKSKMKTKSDAVSSFIRTKTLSGIETKSCCGDEQHQERHKQMTFSSTIHRREAWLAMILLRDLESE